MKHTEMKDSSFCCFCFSLDRKTTLIESNELEFFNAFLSQDKLFIQQLYNESKLNICYECQGRIKSIQKFIRRANVNMQILKNYWTFPSVVLPAGYNTLTQSKKILIQYLPPKNLVQTEKTSYLHKESNYLTKTVKVEKVTNYMDTPKRVVLKSDATIDVNQEDVITNVGDSKFDFIDAVEHRDGAGHQLREADEIDIERDNYSSVDVTEHDNKSRTSDRDEDIDDILLAMVTRPKPKETDSKRNESGKITIAPSTSVSVEDVVEVRTSSDSDEEFGMDFTDVTKNKSEKKSVASKSKGKPLENGWLNLWVSEEQAQSWYRTATEQRTCADDTCVCDLCKQGFKEKEELKRHLLWHHYDFAGGAGLTCNICKYIFQNHLALHQHARHHYMLYKCDRCDYQTRDLNLIQTHTAPAHVSVGNEAWQISTLSPVTILSFCKRCKIYFTTDTQYLKHAELYGCYKVLTKCDFCSKVFASNNLKIEHMTSFHDQPLTVECNMCKGKYRNATSLKSHMQRKHNLDNYMEKSQDNGMYCKQCDLFFTNTYNYKHHVKTSSKHIGLKHKCPHCGKSFSCPRSLQSHVDVIHLNTRTFRCEQCPKRYPTRRMLVRHVSKVHDKTFVPIRNKICDVCGKGFLNKNTLACHKNVHTGERPFKCTLCSSTFQYQAALYTHNKLVHLKQKRPCDLKKLKKKPENDA